MGAGQPQIGMWVGTPALPFTCVMSDLPACADQPL